MSGALRKTTIEIDWKINNQMLQKADEETDRIVRSADKMERNFNQSARSVDGTTRAIHKQSNEVRESATRVDKLDKNFKEAKNSANQFGNSAKGAVDKTKNSVDSAKNSVNKLDNEIDKTTKNANSKFSALKTTIIAVGSALLVAGGKAMFNYASDTNESLNKVDVAFKGNAKNVKRWSKTTLDNIGLAQGTALDLAATYGDMSTSMGLNTQEAEKMSTSMVDLAGNLASFKNIDIDRANTALNGVFTGETEALKSLGIVMTQTNLEQFALETGAGKVAKSSTEVTKQNIAREKAQKKLNEAIKEHGKNSLEAREAQNKLQEIQAKTSESAKVNLKDMKQDELVRLRYNYVMKQTTNAHGDFKNTSDQAANASRVFSESVKELASNAGQFLLPVITPLIIKASDFTKKLSDIPSAVKGMKEKFKPAFEVFESVGDFFKKDLIPSAKELAKSMGPGFIEGGVLAFKGLGIVLNTTVIPAFKAVTKFTRENPDSMKRIAKYATVGVAGFLGFKLVKNTIDKVTKAVGRMNEKLMNIGPSAAAGATEANVAMSTIGTTADGAGGVALPGGKGKGKVKLFSKATTGLKSMGKFGKLASGVGVLGVGLSATELIGMNKDNAGEKTGGFGGSLGGMAGGAAIGTAIAPGIGTAIGGAIGAFAGTALGKELGKYVQKEGPKILDKFKTGWKGLSKIAEEHPILGANINVINKTIDAAKKGIKAVGDTHKAVWNISKAMVADPLKIDAGGKGVSKDSAKAMNEYLRNEQKMQDSRVEIMVSGRRITEKELENNIKTYDKMSDQLIAATDKKSAKANKDWDKLVALGAVSKDKASAKKNTNNETASINKADIKANNEELKALERQFYKGQEEITRNAENRINAIKQKASKEKRKLTKDEEKEIQRMETTTLEFRRSERRSYEKDVRKIEEKQRKEAAIALTASAKEQKIILGNLENSKEKMSAKAAASVVKNSAKARDASVKEANKEYKQTKKILDEKRFVTGEISEEEYQDALKNAKKKKNGVVKEAEKMHDNVVREAQQQAKGHLREVDWETGETLSKWDQFKKATSETFNSIKDAALGKWNELSSATVNIFGGMKDASLRVWDSFKTNLYKMVNNVITAVNKVLSFFSIGSIPLLGNGNIGASQENKLSAKDKKTYHSTSQSGNLAMNYTGSDSAAGQIMAGEEGFEIAYNKNSAQARILGKNGPEITTVAPGTKILNHAESKKMMSGGMGAGTVLPGFAKGTNGAVESLKSLGSNAIDSVKNAGNKVKDVASSAWDFATDPVAGVNKLMAKYNKLPNNSPMANMAGGMFKYFGKGAGDWLKEKLADVFMTSDGGGEGGGMFSPHFGSPFRMTSGYGPRTVFGKQEFHKGIDYGAPTGTPLPAQYGGKVSRAGTAGGFGNLVSITAGKGIENLYGHLSKILTSAGSVVKAGQIIGLVGSTGRSTGPHVHYQVNQNGKPVNPSSSLGGGSFNGKGGSKAVNGWVQQAIGLTGVPASWSNALATIAMKESNGNPNAVNNWDINAKRGMASQGLMQTIPATFNAYKMKGHGNILNPVDNIIAAIGYIKARYGTVFNVPGIKALASGKAYKGYKRGGRPPVNETVLVGEEGPELFETDTAGTVHTAQKTKQMLNKSSGGTTINFNPTINITVEGGSSESESSIRKTVRAEMEKLFEKLVGIYSPGEV
ncbi:peptidoglycan DD-metalloendopeptidase family protein [Listeria monocytogenes]|uniref:Peptidoglycan DD-metalloendopeptidase family protein n=1 Tax=Listeria monocytogenes TaxID=1639 RepID=A0A6Y6TLF4_LISMN|nr:peptidoglycan DD-metalloendopeptidase family protein [Listeria monocytogenes]AQP59455.1 phage tail tape measure protein [Listeria monocytogenes]EAC2203419.1 phage tail tape measure protein [Listeria monocytogenes]EAC3631629.1 phage tail tape measure protein [Listeria monocytogenes]EAC3643045.1 phage tail tape measure protein [Listeria monocytogenes]EAC4104986.1 phage tail tape measure protein [Listeria monocytogenes]